MEKKSNSVASLANIIQHEWQHYTVGSPRSTNQGSIVTSGKADGWVLGRDMGKDGILLASLFVIF